MKRNKLTERPETMALPAIKSTTPRRAGLSPPDMTRSGHSKPPPGMSLELRGDATGGLEDDQPAAGPSPRTRIRSKLEHQFEQAMAGDTESAHLYYLDNRGGGQAAKASDEAKLLESYGRGRRRGVTLSNESAPMLSPRRSLLVPAEQWYQVGNYAKCEALLTQAVVLQGENPTWEVLNKRAAARSKLGGGQAAADSARQYTVLGDGWFGLGEFSRAVGCFEEALRAGPPEAVGGREAIVKRLHRAMKNSEAEKPLHERRIVAPVTTLSHTQQLSHARTRTPKKPSAVQTNAQASARHSCRNAGARRKEVSTEAFFEHAARAGALCGRALLELMLREGDSFGIPPMRLVKGAVLDVYKRFPRSSEEHLITHALPINSVDLLGPSPQHSGSGGGGGAAAAASFGVHFVSHRWASGRAPDTTENEQATALLRYLDSEANPTKDTWRNQYFWSECG
eukprot:COSAG05_NODE_895_length_6700_cov_14.354189_12_plen_453_part_00